MCVSEGSDTPWERITKFPVWALARFSVLLLVTMVVKPESNLSCAGPEALDESLSCLSLSFLIYKVRMTNGLKEFED